MNADPGLLLVGALVALFILAGIVIVAIAARGGARRADGSQPSLGMAAGMLFGGALGAIVWISTGQFVFWVIFMGGGMVLGLAIGSSRGARLR